jgi:hypothetical protein
VHWNRLWVSLTKKHEKHDKSLTFSSQRTTFSGCSYVSTRPSPTGNLPVVRQILNWPGSTETYRKVRPVFEPYSSMQNKSNHIYILLSSYQVPTCLVYKEGRGDSQVIKWGLEAKNWVPREGEIKSISRSSYQLLYMLTNSSDADANGSSSSCLQIRSETGLRAQIPDFPVFLSERSR